MGLTSRPSTAAPILAMLAIVLPLLLLAAYVGSYFALCDYYEGTDSASAQVTIRCYQDEWVRTIFAPAAWTEERMTGTRTIIYPPID